MQNFFQKLTFPLTSFKTKYLAILTIYIANSFAIFSHISETFWLKNSLSLTASEIISITIWANMPWSMKIIFGQVIDSVKIIGSKRNIYIYIAALVIFMGNLLSIGLANGIHLITSITSTYNLLIISGTLINLGIVIQDLIADTLCYEVVDRRSPNGKIRSKQEIKSEIGNIQVLARIADIATALIATTISGYLASNYSYAFISYLMPIVPLISIIGCIIVKKEPVTTKEFINYPILIGGFVYILFIIFLGQIKYEYSLETIFIIGTIIIISSIYYISIEQDSQWKKEVFWVLAMLFAYRATPTFGPGVEWWQIDILHFDPSFYAQLAQFSIVLSFIGLCLLANKVVKMKLAKILLILNSLNVIMQLPMIGMAYGLHEWTNRVFGFGAKTITLFDNIVEGPFTKLSFLITCAAITYYTPKKHVVSWFALTMSLMSLAYISASRIIKKYIADYLPITRGHYEMVGDQMIATNLINFLLPTIVILIAMKILKKKI